MDVRDEYYKLYKDAFDDSERYIKYFIYRKLKDNKTVTYEKDGQIISLLHLIDKKVVIHEKEVKIPYIVAASTLTEYRHQGYFEKVMQKALVKLHDENVPFVMLYPENFKYYLKYGFIVSDRSYVIKSGKGNTDIYLQPGFDAGDFINIYNYVLKGLNRIKRDKNTMTDKYIELCASDVYSEDEKQGEAFYITNGKEVLGYTIVSGPWIEELIYKGDVDDLAHIEFLTSKHMDLYNLDNSKNIKENTMLKITNVPSFLSLLNYKEKHNKDGYFSYINHMNERRVIKYSLGEKNKFKDVTDKKNNNNDIEEIDLKDLAKVALGLEKEISDRAKTSKFLSFIEKTNSFFVDRF